MVLGPLVQGASEIWLVDIDAISPTDAWATGEWSGDAGDEHGLLLHWNGTSWKAQKLRPPVADWVSVSATSSDDVWLAGYSDDASVMLHWNGVKWLQYDLPKQLRPSSVGALSADSPDDAWALGFVVKDGQSTRLVGHWDGSSWQLHR
jgi:hypothetical protein